MVGIGLTAEMVDGGVSQCVGPYTALPDPLGLALFLVFLASATAGILLLWCLMSHQEEVGGAGGWGGR